jgi:hypothetical protein
VLPRSALRQRCTCDDGQMTLSLPIGDAANELLSPSPLALPGFGQAAAKAHAAGSLDV